MDIMAKFCYESQKRKYFKNKTSIGRGAIIPEYSVYFKVVERVELKTNSVVYSEFFVLPSHCSVEKKRSNNKLMQTAKLETTWEESRKICSCHVAICPFRKCVRHCNRISTKKQKLTQLKPMSFNYTPHTNFN